MHNCMYFIRYNCNYNGLRNLTYFKLYILCNNDLYIFSRLFYRTSTIFYVTLFYSYSKCIQVITTHLVVFKVLLKRLLQPFRVIIIISNQENGIQIFRFIVKLVFKNLNLDVEQVIILLANSIC